MYGHFNEANYDRRLDFWVEDTSIWCHSWRFIINQTHIFQFMAISMKQIMIDAWTFECRDSLQWRYFNCSVNTNELSESWVRPRFKEIKRFLGALRDIRDYSETIMKSARAASNWIRWWRFIWANKPGVQSWRLKFFGKQCEPDNAPLALPISRSETTANNLSISTPKFQGIHWIPEP